MVYGDPLSAETYEGPREYEAMAAFAKEHISKPVCSVFKTENCSPEEKMAIQGIESQSDEELLAAADKVEKLVRIQEELFDTEVAKIQEQYDALVENFNAELEAIKQKFHYKYLEQIMTIREIAKEGEYEDDEGGESEQEL